MEKLSEIIPMDSLRQENKEQTGSNEKCLIHNEELWSLNKRNICRSCEDERLEKEKQDILYQDRISELGLTLRGYSCTFEDYIPKGGRDKKIKDKCIKYANSFPKCSSSLIMIGGVGTGKTHLATAICMKAVETLSAKMTTIPKMIRDIRSSWGGDLINNSGLKITEDDLIRKYSRDYQLLVIDEIGSQYGTDSEKVIISEIINNRYENMLPTIVVGNLTITEMESYLGLRVVDRLRDNGQIFVFDWGSHRKLKE